MSQRTQQSRKQPRRRKIASLDSIFIEGAEDGPTVVLFHGFGANMSDLAPLAEILACPPETNWVFPNGHQVVPLGDHFEGNAWFPISIAELERSMATGQAIDWSRLVPPGLDEARDRALELISELGVASEKLIVGGFSQGGMLAADLVMQMEKAPLGLALLSATLINAEEWTRLAPRHKGFQFFQSHGSRDPVLSFAMAQRLERLLLDAGWIGQLYKFEGAHEIPPGVLGQLSSYLRRRMK